jgi:PhoPQ-activated pathogenicity-related protein
MRKLLSILLLASAACAAGKQTALDRFIQTPDPSFTYELVKTLPGDGYTAYVLDLTSQAWRGPSDTSRPIWKHWLTVIKPDRLEGSTGFLFITGGSITAPAPVADPNDVDTALASHSVVATLRGVPNEPVSFTEEGKSRNEDQIIAFTWVKFLKTGDETWPLHFPMAKAAVRAMDAVTKFCASQKVTVEKFFVSGGSKRGWTTWLTAAADPRVMGIGPMVIDCLNNEKSFDHHYRAYGFYSEAVHDYQEMGLMDVAGTRQYEALMRLEDPYSYRERYTMPKFIMNSAGDQYFLPDSSRFYFDDLPGEKYLRYVPNTDHSLRNSDARQSLIAFYDAVLHHRPLPKFSWRFAKDGDILVKCVDKPSEIKLWQATNPDKRDFRLVKLGPAYKSSDVIDRHDGSYEAKLKNPEKGWTASFVELTYPSGGKYPFKFTTAVRISPDTLPYAAPKRSGKLTE